MNQKEAKSITDEIKKILSHITSEYLDADAGSKREKGLYGLLDEATILEIVADKEYDNELYGNLSKYRDEALALLEATSKLLL